MWTEGWCQVRRDHRQSSLQPEHITHSTLHGSGRRGGSVAERNVNMEPAWNTQLLEILILIVMVNFMKLTESNFTGTHIFSTLSFSI